MHSIHYLTKIPKMEETFHNNNLYSLCNKGYAKAGFPVFFSVRLRGVVFLSSNCIFFRAYAYI